MTDFKFENILECSFVHHSQKKLSFFGHLILELVLIKLDRVFIYYFLSCN
jgi:hypothetical protein